MFEESGISFSSPSKPMEFSQPGYVVSDSCDLKGKPFTNKIFIKFLERASKTHDFNTYTTRCKELIEDLIREKMSVTGWNYHIELVITIIFTIISPMDNFNVHPLTIHAFDLICDKHEVGEDVDQCVDNIHNRLKVHLKDGREVLESVDDIVISYNQYRKNNC